MPENFRLTRDDHDKETTNIFPKFRTACHYDRGKKKPRSVISPLLYIVPWMIWNSSQLLGWPWTPKLLQSLLPEKARGTFPIRLYTSRILLQRQGIQAGKLLYNRKADSQLISRDNKYESLIPKNLWGNIADDKSNSLWQVQFPNKVFPGHDYSQFKVPQRAPKMATSISILLSARKKAIFMLLFPLDFPVLWEI